VRMLPLLLFAMLDKIVLLLLCELAEQSFLVSIVKGLLMFAFEDKRAVIACPVFHVTGIDPTKWVMFVGVVIGETLLIVILGFLLVTEHDDPVPLIRVWWAAGGDLISQSGEADSDTGDFSTERFSPEDF